MSTNTIHQTNVGSVSRYDKLIEDLKFSHFGLMSMAILIGSCLGGITAMFVFENHAPFWEFAIALIVTMANLVASIAQAPTKWVLNVFVLSLAVNAILILINMF